MLELVIWLAVFGVDCQMQLEYGYNPFCLACEQGRVDVVKLLLKLNWLSLKRGCTTNQLNYLGHTGWDCAELAGHTEVMQTLDEEAKAQQVSLDETERQIQLSERLSTSEVTEEEDPAVASGLSDGPSGSSRQYDTVITKEALEKLISQRTRLQLAVERRRRRERPERWKLKVSERFVRRFLPHPTHECDEQCSGGCTVPFPELPDWRQLSAREGAFGTLWRREELSPPIHVRNQPPVTSA